MQKNFRNANCERRITCGWTWAIRRLDHLHPLQAHFQRQRFCSGRRHRKSSQRKRERRSSTEGWGTSNANETPLPVPQDRINQRWENRSGKIWGFSPAGAFLFILETVFELLRLNKQRFWSGEPHQRHWRIYRKIFVRIAIFARYALNAFSKYLSSSQHAHM